MLTKFSQVVEDNVRLKQLSEAMYKDDKAEAVREFRELLGSLSPELVMLFSRNIFTLQCVFSASKVGRTAVNDYGSVLRDAVLERKTDFIRILLEHG